MGWPSTEVITSPGTRPLDCAALPHKMPTMSAPVPAGAILAGTPGCWPAATHAAPAWAPGRRAPRPAAAGWGWCSARHPRPGSRAGRCTRWGWPARRRSRRAMIRALSIGMANPMVPPLPARAGVGRGDHADDLACAVGQRAARVALLDQRVGLQHVVQVLGGIRARVAGLDGAVQPVDDARGGRHAATPVGVAQRQHRRAHLDLRGVAETDRGQARRPDELEQRDVIFAVVAHHPGLVRPARVRPGIARYLVAPSITWLLVSTRPEADRIIPVPSAVSLWYLSAAVMSTRPGLTFRSTAAWLSAAPLLAVWLPAVSCGEGISRAATAGRRLGAVTREGQGQPGRGRGRTAASR